jgi:hypothetical protein
LFPWNSSRNLTSSAMAPIQSTVTINNINERETVHQVAENLTQLANYLSATARYPLDRLMPFYKIL